MSEANAKKNQESLEIQSKLMLALDFPTADEAQALVEKLEGYRPWLKVGMELYYAAGPSFVYKLKEAGFSIFLDLKLHDIPNTVKGAATSITRLGVDMFNVHCYGGKRMMEAALEGVEKAGLDHKPLVIGVTHLTSTSLQMYREELQGTGDLDQAILQLAGLAKHAGLHGVVCSPLEVPRVKNELGDEFLTVTPGIRPSSASLDDQVRVATPKQAIELGSDYLVIGRAVTKANEPTVALQAIMNEIGGKVHE